MTRSSYWFQDICPCDLDRLWNWPLSGAFVFQKHILFLLYVQASEMFHLPFNKLQPDRAEVKEKDTSRPFKQTVSPGKVRQRNTHKGKTA